MGDSLTADQPGLYPLQAQAAFKGPRTSLPRCCIMALRDILDHLGHRSSPPQTHEDSRYSTWPPQGTCIPGDLGTLPALSLSLQPLKPGSNPIPSLVLILRLMVGTGYLGLQCNAHILSWGLGTILLTVSNSQSVNRQIQKAVSNMETIPMRSPGHWRPLDSYSP